MTRFLTLAAGLALLLAREVRAQAPLWQWAQTPGLGVATAAAVDRAGNTYVAGNFSGNADFGTISLTTNGTYDLFVAKLRPDGSCVWATQATGFNDDAVTALAVDPAGNVVVAGKFSSPTLAFGPVTVTNSGSRGEIFVARLSPTGVWQAAASAGGPAEDEVRALATDGSGHIYVTGRLDSQNPAFGNITLTTAGNGDLFVAKLVLPGGWQWAVNAPGSGEDVGNALAADASGHVYVAGYFLSPALTFGATTLAGSGVPGRRTAFVARLDTAGAWQWAQTLGAPGANNAAGLAVDAQGDAVIVGPFTDTAQFGTRTVYAVGEEDVFVAKVNPAGQWQWVATGGGTGPDVPNAVGLDAGGNVFITGTFASPTAPFGGTMLQYGAAPGSFLRGDVFVARLSGTGLWQWATQTTSTLALLNSGNAVAPDALGGVVVAGAFRSPNFTLDAHTLTNPTGMDVSFIARLQAPVGLADEPSTACPFCLWPNPAHQTVNFSSAPVGPVYLLDALGRTVRTVQPSPLTASPASPLAFDLTGLAAGLYIVRCGGGAQKLVVE